MVVSLIVIRTTRY